MAEGNIYTRYAKYFNGPWRVLWHVLFWLFYTTDEWLAVFGVTEPPIYGHLGHFSLVAISIAITYFNLYVLIPRLFQKGKVVTYFLVIISIILLWPALSNAIENWLLMRESCEDCEQLIMTELSEYLSYFIWHWVELVFIIGTTSALGLLRNIVQLRGKVQQLENEKLQTELDLLKAQINPHFLFNSLNNIFILSRTEPSEASDAILQLSDLLRYQLYEAAKDRVLLTKEVDYLYNFLELHRLRREGLQLDFEVEGTTSGILLPPFLFIPFVENAVKHGGKANGTEFISCHMTVSPGRIHYVVANSVAPVKKEDDALPGGLGLDNLQRRLDLLYPGRHTLELKPAKDRFDATLTLQLK